MCSWNYVGISTTSTSSLASKTLRDHLGQPLIGKHKIILHEFYIKLKKDQHTPLLCTLGNIHKRRHF